MNRPSTEMRRRGWAAVAAVILFSVVSLSAKTVAEYREEVNHLREDFAALLEPLQPGEEAEYERFEAEVFEEVREFVNDRDRIGFSGSEIEADNSWLTERINEYKAGAKSQEERAAILAAIFERLGAIENKLHEVELAEGTAVPKDKNKQKLSEILSREEYRRGPEEADESLFTRFMRWLEEAFRELFPPREAPQPSLNSPDLSALGFALQIALYALVIGLVGFLIYKFAPRFLRKKKDAEEGEKRDRVVLGERIEAGVTPAELYSEAERLVREGRVREALRKGYIALLFGLSERKAISLAKHKTNRDYLNELSKRSDVHSVVSGLTSQYERHWYGTTEAAEDEWFEFAGGYSDALGRKRG